MASEYWKWKFKDVQPEEKRELTPEEKLRNWWYYHKWHIAAGAVLIAVPCSIAWNALHQIKPDYQIAYVGENALPGDTVTALETELAALGEDLATAELLCGWLSTLPPAGRKQGQRRQRRCV